MTALIPVLVFAKPDDSPGPHHRLRAGNLAEKIDEFIGLGSAYLWYWKGKGPHGITERNKLARTGYKVLENKYYLDWLYTDVIVGFIKGPFAKATNWFNQNVLDGVVNSVGKGAREAGEAERAVNPRARSARLRAAVRTDAPAWGPMAGRMAA